MVDKNKRQFFKRGFMNQVAGVVAGFQEGVAKAKSKDDFEQFFKSDESCSALALAYPDDVLLETARQYGIAIQGRSKRDIVKELFLKQGGDAYRF